MPSPLGHGLAGMAVHALTAKDASERRDPWRLGLLVGVAAIPDVDLLFKYIDGRPHHQGMTHSVGFALLAGFLAWAVARFTRKIRPLRAGFAVAAAYASHIALDYFSRDTHPPIGLRLLWPFRDGFYKSPYTIFMDIGRELDWTTVVNNARAGLWEVVLLAPITWLAWRVTRRRSEA